MVVALFCKASIRKYPFVYRKIDTTVPVETTVPLAEYRHTTARHATCRFYSETIDADAWDTFTLEVERSDKVRKWMNSKEIAC